MHPKNIPLNQNFIGRPYELRLLEEISDKPQSSIVIVYGRRRIGKTELLEQAFRKRNVLKFEGLEGQSDDTQMQQVMELLAEYTNNPLLRNITTNSWRDVFKYIHQFTATGTWTIYFEELQWLANYKPEFISELKFAWDNYFRYNPHNIVVLCGSSPSFMIKHVIHSKALYNRSQYEIGLQEFNLIESRQLLSKYPKKDILDAYLSVGGIPEYLLRLQDKSSLFLSLCSHSFTTNSFFLNEYKKIFISSLADNPRYEAIIAFLAKQRFATRNDIMKHLQISSGGRVSELLDDLVLCRFIEKYTPYNLAETSLLARYAISDNYLRFYYKFIKPIAKDITQGKFVSSPASAINRDTYNKWLGFAFERFCRKYSHVLAKILGIAGIKYNSGAYFNRQTEKDQPGFQIDLLFDRDDNVISICEIKYLQKPISKKVIEDFEKKTSLLSRNNKKMIHRVLITVNDEDKNSQNQAFFDSIITLNDLFQELYWQ